MKALHIITGLNTGGAEKALLHILSGGLARRYDSIVLSLQDEGTVGCKIQELGVPVYTLGMRSGLPGLKALRRLFQIVRDIKPDLIQGWMYHGNLAASLAGWMAPGSPAVSWNVRHSLYDIQAEKPLTRQVIRANSIFSGLAQSIIYNSRLSRSQHEAFGFRRCDAKVIPNGFDLDFLKPFQEDDRNIRCEFAFPTDAIVIGHIARFHPLKDHASFLRAAVQVAQHRSDVRFLLVGREVSPDNPALGGIVPSHLLERFTFTGERNDVHRLIQAMDVFCLSSNSEAFPNVLGEAMATGVPCVTTDVGDSADIVGDTGVVVPPSNSGLLAEGLLSLIGMSGHARQELGMAARRRIKERYSLETVVGQYEKLYEELIRRKS